jgi:hypothetical protein
MKEVSREIRLPDVTAQLVHDCPQCTALCRGLEHAWCWGLDWRLLLRWFLFEQ